MSREQTRRMRVIAIAVLAASLLGVPALCFQCRVPILPAGPQMRARWHECGVGGPAMSAAAVTKAEFIATCKSGPKNGGPVLRAMIAMKPVARSESVASSSGGSLVLHFACVMLRARAFMHGCMHRFLLTCACACAVEMRSRGVPAARASGQDHERAAEVPH